MKITAGRIFVYIMALLATVISTAAHAEDKAKEIVRVRGSESMTHFISMYADEFSPSEHNCNLVISGGDFHMGMENLRTGEAEIAMLSARASDAELKGAKSAGLDIQEAIIGWGGIVIIVHPTNPIVSLTVDQVRKLLTGQYTDWSQVGGPSKPVLVVGITDTVRGGTDKYITEEFLHGAFAPGAKLVSYFRSIPPTVAENEGAIGVIRLRNLERLHEQGQDKSTKEIAVKKDEGSAAVMPTRESIDEGIYPITRPYFLYLASNKSNKCALDFFNYCAARNPRAHGASGIKK